MKVQIFPAFLKTSFPKIFRFQNTGRSGSQNTAEDLAKFLNEEYDFNKLKAEVENPESFYYFCYFNDELAGYLKLNIGSTQTESDYPEALEIQRIYVLQKYQGQKIGLSMMQHAIAVAKKIKKCQTDQEKKALLENSRYQKLLFRKEMNHRKNRNYHYHPGYSQELIPYLEWNKRIHQKELKKNIGIIALCLPIILFSTPSGILFPLCIGLSIVETISAVINFECINLQDYNLTRIKQNEKLKRIEEKIVNRDLHQYSPATKVIASSLEKSTDIPSVQSLKQEITTKEELENLKQLLLYLKQNQLQENLSPKHKVYRKEKES